MIQHLQIIDTTEDEIYMIDGGLKFSSDTFNLKYMDNNGDIILGRRATNVRRIQFEDGQDFGHTWVNIHLDYIGKIDPTPNAPAPYRGGRNIINPATGCSVDKKRFLEQLEREGLTYKELEERNIIETK